MAKPGRKKGSLSPEQKLQRKAAKQAAKDEAIRAGAVARMPKDKKDRDELFRELDNLKKDAQAISGSVSHQKKRMREVFGLTKETIQIRAILAGCPDARFEATMMQLGVLMKDLNRPFQMELFQAEPGKGVAEDPGSIFDQSRAGEAVSAERGDDAGRARKRTSEPPHAPPSDTGALSPEEAQAAFEKNTDKVVSIKRGKAKGTTEAISDVVAEGEAHIKAARKPKGDPLPGAEGTGTYAL